MAYAKHRVSKNQHECKPMKPTGLMRKAAVGESVKYRKQAIYMPVGSFFAVFLPTRHKAKTKYCTADAIECAGTDENRDCATPAPQPVTLTGIKIDGRVQAP